jgi:hypothetical protein
MSVIPMRLPRDERSTTSSKADPVQLICVDPIGVPIVWPMVSSHIGAAILRGGNLSSFQAMAQDVFNGRALLWVAWDGIAFIAAAVTHVGDINGVRIGIVMALGGRGIPRFGWMLAELEKYFVQCGCVRSRICGRRGWLRIYPDYKQTAVVMEKKLCSAPSSA